PDTVRKANRTVFRKASEDPNLAGMGTTLTAILADGDSFRVAHIGDSRLYLLRDGDLKRLTTDHTVVERLVEEGRLTPEEAGMHPQRSILTKALGVDEEVEPDDDRVEVHPGDRLLLCSDGLTGMVGESEIEAILTSNAEPQAAADSLVDAANRAGGQDNITAVVVDVVDDDAAPAAPSAPPVTVETDEPTAPTAAVSAPVPDATRPSRDLSGQPFSMGPRRGRWAGRLLLWVLLPLLLIAGGLWATKTYWVDKQFYVGQSAGHVAVFRGIPAAPLGYDLSQPIEEFPDLTADSVTAFPEYAGLADGITAASEEDARAIVAEMQMAVAEAEPEQQV
ncbi:MAG: SpoIIE family protein phosphatase, partial [Actinomycetota bacterium]|nr:SpoIIE family protein phosphatase [Actinomycetota bacterium]